MRRKDLGINILPTQFVRWNAGALCIYYGVWIVFNASSAGSFLAK